MKTKSQDRSFLRGRWNVYGVLMVLLLMFTSTISASVPNRSVGRMELLQFTSGGHVVGFHPNKVYLASISHALSLEFLGTKGVMPEAEGGSTGKGAPPLKRVRYVDLWPGISVRYESEEGKIAKSTYFVEPGADVGRIQLAYNVPVEVQSDGSLRFSYKNGYMMESAPLAWQEVEGKRLFLPVAFRVSDGNRVGFSVRDYDARYPLVIDPSYQWHTFYGSSHYDHGCGIAVDGSGNIYVIGRSNGTWQGDGGATPLHGYSGGDDIVVVKLNSNGAYQWHTFYGSSNNDSGEAIAVDGSGNVYITGWSEGSWQGDGGATPLHGYSGGDDIVVVKLNSNGAYQWHTFYGSSSDDNGYGIAVDGSGNVYVTGYSSDLCWQGDGGANPLHPHSGCTDIVVVKLNSNGAFQWHTFYGSSHNDFGWGIAVDGSGNVYITGDSVFTWQGDGGANPLHPDSGGDDIVVVKLNSNGAYQWHTFYGSSHYDHGYGVAVDGSGNIYVTGSGNGTWQGDGGKNPLHPHSGGADIVVVKLNSNGAYQWHTFYGSSSDDNGYGIAVDGSGNVYVTGGSKGTWQGDGGASPLHHYSGDVDIVILYLNTRGAYQWHTFYGGIGSDEGSFIALDGSGNIYVTGSSGGSWQGDDVANPLHSYSGDFVVLKLSSCDYGMTASDVNPTSWSKHQGETISGSFNFNFWNRSGGNSTMLILVAIEDSSGNWVGGEPKCVYGPTIPGQCQSNADSGTGSFSGLSAPSTVGTYNVVAYGAEALDCADITSKYKNKTVYPKLILGTLTVSAGSPAISVSPGSLDFGSVKSGKKTTKTLKITNNGSGDLLITLSGLEGTDFSIQGSSSVTIKAKKSYSLKVLCRPTSGGLKTAVLEIESTDPDTPTLEISLTATLPATTPDISVPQTTIEFGSVKVGKKGTKTLKITNNGSGDLLITLSGLEGADFSIQGSSSVTIKAKKSYSLKVLFTPGSTGLETATLKITSNDPDTPTIDVSLSGTGQ